MNAAPAPVDLAAVLARGDIWRGDALASLPETSIPSGHAALDAELPGGGWPRGNLTEILVDRSGLGEMALLLPALAQLSAAGGWLALVAPPWLPHAPAWAAAGVALERLVIVRAGRQAAKPSPRSAREAAMRMPPPFCAAPSPSCTRRALRPCLRWCRCRPGLEP